MKAIEFASEKEVVVRIEFVVQSQEAEPAAIVADEVAGSDGRDDGRGLIFTAKLAADAEMSRLVPAMKFM